ncbi:MAG: nitronate monooxygenase family protein [Acidobacteriota bacterium]|jgi:enoyl-[acyl-carrier protein] reductase II|nr:nitronate monooxygenase family protein [Acidobacteriota bacterium]
MIAKKHQKYWQRGRDFLGVEYPLIAGAMTWISTSGLVKSVAGAGAFGVLAAGNMPAAVLEQEVMELKASGCRFAVNLITIAPNYLSHLEKVASWNVPYIVFAGSFPRQEEVRIAKESGARVLCFASNDSIAERMIAYGADALILEGSEAGGHIGHVSTIVLIQQVLFHYPQLPVFVAGGIASGRMIAHLLLMGAAGVQMGTIFAMAEESPAHPAFKEKFRKARSREAFATPQYSSALPVVAVRALKNKGSEEFGRLQLELIQKLERGEIHRTQAQFEVEKYWVGALRRAVQDGDVEYGSLMAGQSVGLIHDTKSVKEIVGRLVAEAEETFFKLGL